MKKYFFHWIEKHLETHDDCLLLVCDLGFPEALDLLQKFPNRVLNVGVSEQNAALVAKGLCSEGFEVFIYGISSFTLWRAAEILKLYFNHRDRLRVIGNGGGFGYGIMGTTHHSIDDLGLVSLWTDWTSWLPARENEVDEVLNLLSRNNGPQYLRLTNNATETYDTFSPLRTFGNGRLCTIVTFGPLLDLLIPLHEEDPDLKIFCIGSWPIDIRPISDHFSHSQNALFVEEHQEQGSLSLQIKAQLEGLKSQIHCLQVTKSHLNGSRNYLLQTSGIDKKLIASLIRAMKNKEHDFVGSTILTSPP